MGEMTPRGERGKRGERGRTGLRGETGVNRKTVAAFIAIVLLAVIGLWRVETIANRADNSAKETRLLALETKRLAVENKNFLSEIQISRQINCLHTYEGIREVFLPFFPPSKGRTLEQQKNLDKFNETVNDLKIECAKQIKPE
jgi:hypothetical protein